MYDVIHISPALCLCLAAFLKQGIVFIKEIHRNEFTPCQLVGLSTDEALPYIY